MLFPNLKNFWQSIKQDRFLLLALFTGLLLRGLNPTFGSPSLYISNDEAIAHLSAFNMIAEKTPISIANYTPLGAYVQIPFLILSFVAMKFYGYVQNISDFELFVLTHEGFFLFIPRLISALFGTLTILVVYKISHALFSEKRIAIIAAFLAAISYNFVHASHFGRPWSASLFFISCALYFAIKKKVFGAYFLIAIAYGFHQVGLLFLPLVFILVPVKKDFKGFISVLTCALMFALFTSLTLKQGVVESIKSGQSFIRSDVVISDLLSGNFKLAESIVRTIGSNITGNFIANIVLTDGIIFAFAVVGIIVHKKNITTRNLLLFVFLYFLFASLFFHPLVRYLVPLFIILIPFSSYAFVYLFEKKAIIIVCLIVLASVNSIWWNYLYLKKPTFIQAHEWIERSVPVGVPIAYTGGRFQTFAPDKDAIDAIRVVNPGSYNRLANILDNKNVTNVSNIVYLGDFPGETKLDRFKSASGNRRFIYVVDYYLDPKDRLFLEDEKYFEIVVKFSPVKDGEEYRLPEPLFDSNSKFPSRNYNSNISKFSLERMGPYFEILRIKNQNL